MPKPPPPETNSRRSLSQQAYDALYTRIITLACEPGQHLEESQLIRELGIGRTPLREAMQRLESDLLLESMPGKGFVVRPLTLQNTKAAFAALKIMELGVAALSVREETAPMIEQMTAANAQVAAAIRKMDILTLVRANSEFHDAYARCSHNIYLIKALQKVRCETNRLAYLSFGNEIDPKRTLLEHYKSVVDQHAQIIEAIGSRDENALKYVIVEHIDIFKNRIINYLAAV